MLKNRQGLMFGPMMNDTQEGINFDRMRKDRAAKARKEMNKVGIANMLVTGAGNVRYLTSYIWMEFQPDLSYTLFFGDHPDGCIVYAHAGAHQQMPDQVPWVKEWRPARAWLSGTPGAAATADEAKLFATEIKEELKKRGQVKEKLGIVGFDEIARDALRAEGLKLVEAWPVLLEASKCKTIDEINCLHMTGTLCSAGWQKFKEIARPGISTGWAHRQVSEHMYSLGAEYVGGVVFSGPATFPRDLPLLGRVMEYGDMVTYPLCATRFMGYTSCTYRCFKIGQKPNEKEKEWYRIMLETLENAIDASRIGNTTADAAKFFPKASHWGWKDEVELLTVEIGHGIGITRVGASTVSYNMPIINNQWSPKHPQPFEEGMVISYESLQGEWRVGGARIELMAVVTKDGPEILDSFPRDEICITG